jgi:two-component system phosphate regulon sensor histidine kinase PhoR
VVRVAGVVTAFCEVMETGRAVSKQIERETAGSSKILDLQVAQVPEPSTEGIRFLLVVRDITQQAQTARIKSEFVGNASHELRTPLATIRAAVDSLATLGPNHQQEREKIREMLDRHTARLEEMTNDLLSLHTLETAKQRLRQDEIDPHALAKWAIEQHADKAKERGILLNMPTEPSDASFRRFTSDLTLIQLILRNLIDNALKFTPREGQVSFRLEVEDDRVLLRVSDTGCGIPPEFQDRVFERFFQVEPSRSGDTRARGTGLGLAIVKHATERLGGTVTLRSEPGTGTTVEVRLPKIRSL